MSVVSPLLDIFDLYPKMKHVGTCPIFEPEIYYEPEAPPPQMITMPKYRYIRKINDKNPETNGKIPLHIPDPNTNHLYDAPLEVGNKMGTPAQILTATYLNQLMPTEVNMAARTNETGIYPYFMNKLNDLEDLIRNRPILPEPKSQPDVINPVEPIPQMIIEQPTIETPVVSEMDGLEEKMRGGRGGARPGAGAPLKFDAEEILAKPAFQRTKPEKAFLARQRRMEEKLKLNK